MKTKSNPAPVLDDLRKLLLQKRAELLADVRPSESALTASGRVAEDDQAVLLHADYVASRLEWLDHQRIKEIDAALDRMSTGDFGICVSCGEEISPKRLAAIPWAQHCVSCQQAAAAAA